MEKDWSVVYKTTNQFEVDIIQGMLRENGIESVIIDQKDSAYMSFGAASLFVHNDNLAKAQELIAQAEKEDTE